MLFATWLMPRGVRNETTRFLPAISVEDIVLKRCRLATLQVRPEPSKVTRNVCELLGWARHLNGICESATMHKPTILLADDDRLILATLGAGLRNANYEVLEATSGEEAIRVCEARQPALAILDVRMPGMSGVEAAQVIRQNAKVPVMFLSAYSDPEVVREAVAEGALGYLLKPIDVLQLPPSIEAALARAAEFRKLKTTESNLNTALSGNREISMAVGVVMERYRLQQSAAFEALRTFARSHRRKLSEVASDLIRAVDMVNMPIGEKSGGPEDLQS